MTTIVFLIIKSAKKIKNKNTIFCEIVLILLNQYYPLYDKIFTLYLCSILFFLFNNKIKIILKLQTTIPKGFKTIIDKLVNLLILPRITQLK